MSRRLLDRVGHLTAMERVSKDPDALAELQGESPTMPALLASWIGQKLIFEGVPFDYMVADDQLLPNESIRFFNIDANWQLALVDGACSIGRLGPLDTATEKAFMLTPGGFLDQARAAAHLTAPIMSGFMLRSQAVRGYWPGIRIAGYADIDATLPLSTVRTECLTTSVLLVLFDGALARVDFHEPPEGMHFGLEGPDHISPVLLQRTLRYLAGCATHDAGDSMDATVPDNRVTVQRDANDMSCMRPGGVLKASMLAGAVQQALIARNAMPASGPFTSAEFALEMIEGVDFVTYSAPSSPEIAQ